MSNLEKVKSVFFQRGYNQKQSIGFNQFFQFLKSLTKNQQYDNEVAQQIWNQTALNINSASNVNAICITIAKAQSIVQNKLIQLADAIQNLQYKRQQNANAANKEFLHKLQDQILQLEEQKVQYECDLRLLTQPFGINPVSFMSKAYTSRRQNNPLQKVQGQSNLDESGNQIQLKWLFYLTVVFGILQIIVIYKKYDFLNQIVLTCLLFIFLMNHFDPTYIKSILALLIVSQIIDMIWLFMNSSNYWNPPGIGVNATYQQGFQKIIVVLTYLGIFVKIPLGVLLFHYRNVSQAKRYEIDVGIVKLSLNSNNINPISNGIDTFSIN